MIFVDACAIVAIISNENEALAYAGVLDTVANAFTSSLAAWEAALVLSRKDKLDVGIEAAGKAVRDWLKTNNVKLQNLQDPQDTIHKLAIHAAQTYGVSRRSLSNFDCFHYAHAKATGASMLTLDKRLRDTDLQCLP